VQVLNYIKRQAGGYTCAELSEAMNKPINEISGRCTELKELGVIVEDGNRINPRSGRKCAVLRAK
jgi:DNA-binding IclR family transcriptional regulator